MNTITHECGIDCKPSVTPTGGVAHIMYPAQPNSAAGRYQAIQNLGMTRREFRESGQDQTRGVRDFDARKGFPRVETCPECGRSQAHKMDCGWEARSQRKGCATQDFRVI